MDELPQGLDQFCQLVIESDELFDQLRAAVDVEHFVALAIQLGQKHGCCFTGADVHELLKAKRRAWFERWV